MSASVTGCLDSSSSNAGDQPHVVFAPYSQQMDLVNDLRFEARFASGVNYETADDGVVSVNGRRGQTLAHSDGFSTTAQFDVTFSKPLDPGSVVFSGAAQNVFVLPLKSNSNDYIALESYQGNASKLIDRAKLAQQQIRANVVTLDGEANVLRISPLVPLSPKTKYLVILTNTLRDINGQSIVPSDDYYNFSHSQSQESGSSIPDAVARWHSMATDALTAIAGGFVEKGKSTYLSAERRKAGEQVAHAFTFTTTAGTEVLEALASPKAALINQGMTEQEADELLASTVNGNAVPQPRKVGIIRRDLSIGDMLDPFLQKLGIVFNSLDSRALAHQFNMPVEQIDQLKLQYKDFKLDGDLLDQLLSDGFKDPTTGFVLSSASFGYPKIKFAQGHITLPYYLAAPDLDNNGHITPGSLTSFGNDEWQYGDPGQTAMNTSAQAAFPYPEQQAEYKVPFLVTLPEARHKPAQGWPVVIFQHGILGDRSNSFPVGMALASLCDKERPQNDCFATIAMDLPLHGISPQLLVGAAAVPSPFIGFGMDSLRKETDEKLKVLDPLAPDYQQQKDKLDARMEEMDGIIERHFSATRTPTGQMKQMSWDLASLEGSSGSTFMNFSNVLSQRDRMRQAISDLLNLNATLKDIDLDGDGIGDFDTSRVYFVGHSLGGVLGMPFVAVNNDPLVHQYNPNLPKIQAAAFLTTGGGVPKLLEHSPSFRPEILRALKHLDADQPLMLGSKAFEHYFYTLQSMIDGADPLNYAANLKASDTGIYMAEVVGGAAVLDAYGYQQYSADGKPMTTLSDQTIPNSADGKPTAPYKGSIAAPLAGTEPMVKLMGLKSLRSDEVVSDDYSVNRGFSVNAEHGYPLKVVARFNRGTHVSPVMALENVQRMLVDNQKLVEAFKSGGMGKEHLSLIYLAADSFKRSGGLFVEMTGQVSDFFTSNGQKVAVNDANFLSQKDPHKGDTPLPPVTLASKQPVTCKVVEVCIIDNDDAAFETVGNWTYQTDRPGDTEGRTYAYASGSGSNYFAHAAWWFRVDKAGTYRVSMRTPSKFAKTEDSWNPLNKVTPHGATTGARYNVFSTVGESQDRMFNLVEGVNNKAPFDYPLAPNGEYVELGEFVFDTDHDYKVTVHNRSVEIITGPLMADAVKIEYVSGNTNLSAAGELERLIAHTEHLVATAKIGDKPGQYTSEGPVRKLEAVLEGVKTFTFDNMMSTEKMLAFKVQFDKALSELEKSKVAQPPVVGIEREGRLMSHRSENFSANVEGELKSDSYGQDGANYLFFTDLSAQAEWAFMVAESGRYKVEFNTPGGFGWSHGYGSKQTKYELLNGHQVLAEKLVSLYDNPHSFEELAWVALVKGQQYKVRVSNPYGSYGIAADAIKVTYQP